MPYRSSAENVIIAARELTHALQNPSPASPLSNIEDKQMEVFHQLAELFQQSVNENNDTPNSVAPPKITPTRQEPQARVPTTTPTHDAHPHRSNIIEDDESNQPLELDHGNHR